jgi:hypothetical protein
LDHLVSLKSYDGKTTLGQLMVQQVCHTHNGNHKCHVSLPSKQLGAAWRTSLLDDLSLCTAASLINTRNLFDNSTSWGGRVEQAVVCVFEHTRNIYIVDRSCGICSRIV